jgi:adenine-specific DNA-methyltransferase
MSQKYEKLKTLLKELFQLDQPDLDFGLYRIMHAKSAEVTQFLDKNLLPQVKQEFGIYKSADKAELEMELAKAVEQAHSLGADPETLPKVKDLRNKLANEAVDLGALESEVYDHLFSFFRRYYSEGDFLTKRVYKSGVYAIPYEGEEVKLHWANNDQYYIKTTEYLRDYSFRLRPNDDKKPMRVHYFRLADAAEEEHGNIKAVEGNDRIFLLTAQGESGRDFIAEENGELVIRFEYRPVTLADWPDDVREGKTKPPTQKDLIAIAEKRLLAVTDSQLVPWIAELGKPHVISGGEKADYTQLEAHLRRYTARNTFDYFIHKDLGGFLRRELDFYIKNEVMHLDDVENETAPRVEQYLSKIKVIRRVAGKLIDFLAQLENFQKKLWLKKKFVVETHYCITLDRIPEAFYPEIAANDLQREEWVRLFAINEIQHDMAEPGYSTPLTVDFLKAHSKLVVDTRHLAPDFTIRLIEAIVNLDEQVDGLLIHSENFQAIKLMQTRYRERVRCIYIDPPYNTDATPILYKNGYKSSSWTALMDDRVRASRSLMSANGVLVAAIDDEQQRELNFVLSEAFDNRLLGTICVRSNPSGRPKQTGYSVSHEYLIFAGRSQESGIGRLPPTDEQMARFSQKDDEGPFEWRNLRREGSDSDRASRRSLYYPIYLSGQSIRVPKMTWKEDTEEWIVDEQPRSGERIVLPDNEVGEEKRWRWEWKTVMASLDSLAVRRDRSGKDYVYYKRRPHEEGVVSVSSWFDAKYSATEHGTALLKDMFGKSPFSYPKSLYAVIDAIYVAGASKPTACVVDYFAGSGTTGHAVIALNRKYGGHRKYVLTEVGYHFDSALLPRLKKAIYSSDWADGRPTSRDSGVSHCLKVIRLESYEDTLNNLETRRTETQQTLLNAAEAQGADGLREQFLLRYMLDVETRGSQTLLNVQAFRDPTAYKLKVKLPGSDESREMNIDLLETFNWLIGITVQHIAAPQSFTVKFERDSEKRLRLKGRLKQDATTASEKSPWWFRTVTGTLSDGRQTLVIWRKLTGDLEQDNLVLDEWFTKQGYSTKDYEFQLIYANGDNNLENLKTPEDTWKVRLIEEDFHHLMFDTENV